jgi:4-carboxymuconolactone decarboxylase
MPGANSYSNIFLRQQGAIMSIRPILDKSQLAPADHDIYNEIALSRGGMSELFGLLLHDPQMADRVAQLGSQIRFSSPLSADVQEILILTVAAELPGSYFWQFHRPLAQTAGVPEDLIEAIKNRVEIQGDSGQLVSYARAVLACKCPAPEIFDAILERFGVPGIVTVTSTVSYYVMLISIMTTFGMSKSLTQNSGTS